MYLPQTDTEFRNALQDAADIAITAFAAETGAIKAYISQNKAGQKYGHGIIRKWLEAGLIHPNQDGRLSVVELEATAKASFTRKLKPITK
ncbi:MAG: hypothetical protein ABFD04_00365 [Syntrophomonas sp.]